FRRSESRGITCVLSPYFFLEVIVCECLRGGKRSTTAKTSRWNVPFIFLAWGALLMRAKKQANESCVIIYVYALGFFLIAFICERFERIKFSIDNKLYADTKKIREMSSQKSVICSIVKHKCPFSKQLTHTKYWQKCEIHTG
ncbi:MAG TPA: hypothetical protein DHV12_04475, partial [Thermotogae bacterium]|nr:hypothetical protein [Thermotogota bacterium]